MYGDAEVPVVDEDINTDKYIEFPTHESIRSHYNANNVSEVFDKYCTLQRESDRKFIVF